MKKSKEELVQKLLAKLYEIEEKVNDPMVMKEIIRLLSLCVQSAQAQNLKQR